MQKLAPYLKEFGNLQSNLDHPFPSFIYTRSSSKKGETEHKKMAMSMPETGKILRLLILIPVPSGYEIFEE